MNIEYFEVDNSYDGERLDKFLAVIYPSQSRTFFQKLIKDGHVFVNDAVEKANYRVRLDDIVR